MSEKNQGLLKDGTRRKTTTKNGRGGGMPRLMWLAILVCLVGAVFMFRNQGADLPNGIGESRTIVTAPDVETNLEQTAPPRSGEVDIDEQVRPLTPETVEQSSGTNNSADSGSKPQSAGTKVAESKPTKPADDSPEVTEPPSDPITPAANGPYVVQVGSFGQADNADKEASRLQGLGWDARVKMGNTSDGSLIYRVRVGYFKSRGDAEIFVKQNRTQMRGAIAVHR